MGKITTCAGLNFNDSDFKIIDEVITDATAQSITNKVISSCNLQFDGAYFKKLSNCMSIAGATSASSTTDSPCSGTLFDATYFVLDGDTISYASGMNATLTFTVTPTDSTIVLKDENNASVTVTNEVANVILGRTYSYTVSNTGYETETGTIKIASATETKSVTLTSEA